MKLLCVHHTVSRQDTDPRGFNFYNIIIGINYTYFTKRMIHDRGNGIETLDVAVVGDFTKHIPTELQINELNKVIKKYNLIVVTHKNIKSYGAVYGILNTVCPGNLMKYITMKKVIVLKGMKDQYLISGNRKILIPDLETRDFLRDVLELIPNAEPEVVDQSVFDNFKTSDKPMPSVKADKVNRDIYKFYKEKLPLLADSYESNKG